MKFRTARRPSNELRETGLRGQKPPLGSVPIPSGEAIGKIAKSDPVSRNVIAGSPPGYKRADASRSE